MTGQDVVIGFSRNGEADEINSLLRVVRQRGAKVVSILENAESTMASLSDLLLRVAVAPENDPSGPIPMCLLQLDSQRQWLACVRLWGQQQIAQESIRRDERGLLEGVRG